MGNKQEPAKSFSVRLVFSVESCKMASKTKGQFVSVGFITNWNFEMFAAMLMVVSIKENKIYILNKIINVPCGTLKLLLALGVAKYIKSYKNSFCCSICYRLLSVRTRQL